MPNTLTFTDSEGDVEVPTTIEGYQISVHEKSNCFEVEDAEGRKFIVLNPGEYDFHSGGRHRAHRPSEGLIGLWFNQCAPTRILVWADGYEDALEEAAGWLADYAPGTFTTFDENDIAAARKEVAEESDLDPEDVSEDAIQEHLETDMTYTESGLIPSDEWGDVCSPEGHPADEALVRVVTALGKLVNPPDEEEAVG